MREALHVSREQMQAALTALYGAGRRLVEAQPHAHWRLKDDGTFLTELDIELQSSLKGPLLEAFPGCVFVSEEDPRAVEAARRAQPRLVLDPIDGTAPFARGLNCFSISLALIDHDGEPRAGIVHMPSRGSWHAGAYEIGGWASYEVEVRDGRACFGRPRAAHPSAPSWKQKDGYVYVSSDALRQLDFTAFEGKFRALGASASHLALLLDGTPDPCAVILTQYRLWDAIAGLALARAAGFEIRDLQRPTEILPLAGFVNELVNSGGAPPLVVGHRDAVRAVIQTIKPRGKAS